MKCILIIKRAANIVLLFLLIHSCKKDTLPPITASVVEMARDSVYYIMKEYYYWYNMPEPSSITELNKDKYKDPYELLEAMKYKLIDKWSIVAPYESFMDYFQGAFVGHGIFFGLDQEGNARINSIYDKSPLYLSGVRRGWIMKKVNNVDIAPLLLSKDFLALSNLIGLPQEGVTNTFIFKTPLGGEITIPSTKTSFKVNSVLKCDTLHLSSGVTGHLVLESFINSTPNELQQAFEYFNANNIKDLILDLRYNSGGLIFGAKTLGNYIIGRSKPGATFLKIQYNDKHQDANLLFLFSEIPNSLALPRIVVIMSRATASASEVLINALKPFINVVMIGDTTEGKPFGMNMWPILNKYVLMPITFKSVNALDEADYSDGFSPNKSMLDDITCDWSDRNELCLKEAIHFLETGSISNKGEMRFRQYPIFSEKPKWLNNALVMGLSLQ